MYVCLNQVAPPPIPLRPPIPERKTNDRPVFLIRKNVADSVTASMHESQSNSRRDEDRKTIDAVPKKANKLERKHSSIDESVYWSGNGDPNNDDELIDLDLSNGREDKRSSVYSPVDSVQAVGGNVVPTNEPERQAFVADFHGNFEERSSELQFKSSFEELKKVSRDLEKRLHEGIVRSVVVGGEPRQNGNGDSNGGRTTRQWDGSVGSTKNGRFVVHCSR